MAIPLEVPALSGPPYSFSSLVGGAEVAGDEELAVLYPYTGEQVAAVPMLSEAQVRSALDRTAAAGPAPDRYARSLVLNAVADRIAAEADGLARLITWESGLCLRDTRYEVRRAVDVFRFAAGEALRDDGAVFACDTSANGRSRRAYSMREPVRLVAAMTPFNHPLNQVAHKVAPAIAAGAPMVLKPSERTPLAALWLGRAILDAGLPPDRLAIIVGDAPSVLATMLEHPSVDVLSFTGGVAVGKHIADRLGYRRAVLELGGNDPLIVLRDADLELATSLAIAGTTRNSGQRCTAVKRILADEEIADELVDRIAAGRASAPRRRSVRRGDRDRDRDRRGRRADRRAPRGGRRGRRRDPGHRRRARRARRSGRRCSTTCGPRWSSFGRRRSDRPSPCCACEVSTRRSRSRTARRTGSHRASSPTTCRLSCDACASYGAARST